MGDPVVVWSEGSVVGIVGDPLSKNGLFSGF